MVDTLTDLIYKFDEKNKILHLDSILVESGKLEAILEESTTNEEVAAFEMNGKEYMLIFRKPCIEYFSDEKQVAIWLYPK